jgi:hypothetical protein
MDQRSAKLVSDFVEWTGCPEEIAISYLGHSSGNFEAAIQNFFNQNGNPDPSGSTGGQGSGNVRPGGPPLTYADSPARPPSAPNGERPAGEPPAASGHAKSITTELKKPPRLNMESLSTPTHPISSPQTKPSPVEAGVQVLLPELQRAVDILSVEKERLVAAMGSLGDLQSVRELTKGYVQNVKIQPAPVAGKVSNVVWTVATESGTTTVELDPLFSVQWFDGTGKLVAKRRMYVPLVDEVGESLRVEVSMDGGKSSFAVYSSPVLPHEKLATTVMEIFKSRKEIYFDVIVHGKGWGKIVEDTSGLGLSITKDKVKLKQRKKTVLKEFHECNVFANSDRQNASTLHVRILGQRFTMDVQKPMYRNTLILLMRVCRASRKLASLQNLKNVENSQRGVASLMRAGGFARGVTYQNDRFTEFTARPSATDSQTQGISSLRPREQTELVTALKRYEAKGEIAKGTSDYVSTFIFGVRGSESAQNAFQPDDSFDATLNEILGDNDGDEKGDVARIRSDTLSKALVGSMFNADEPRSRAASVETDSAREKALSKERSSITEQSDTLSEENVEENDGGRLLEKIDAGVVTYKPQSEMEEKYYQSLFVMAGASELASVLGGKDAVPFFTRAGVSIEVLKIVWDISDFDKLGSLTLKKFYVAMRLISMVQADLPLSASNLKMCRYEPLDLPRFADVSVPTIKGDDGGNISSSDEEQVKSFGEDFEAGSNAPIGLEEQPNFAPMPDHSSGGVDSEKERGVRKESGASTGGGVEWDNSKSGFGEVGGDFREDRNGEFERANGGFDHETKLESDGVDDIGNRSNIKNVDSNEKASSEKPPTEFDNVGFDNASFEDEGTANTDWGASSFDDPVFGDDELKGREEENVVNPTPDRGPNLAPDDDWGAAGGFDDAVTSNEFGLGEDNVSWDDGRSGEFDTQDTVGGNVDGLKSSAFEDVAAEDDELQRSFSNEDDASKRSKKLKKKKSKKEKKSKKSKKDVIKEVDPKPTEERFKVHDAVAVEASASMKRASSEKELEEAANAARAREIAEKLAEEKLEKERLQREAAQRAEQEAEEEARRQAAELEKRLAKEMKVKEAEIARKKAEEAEIARKKAEEVEIARKKAEEAEISRKKAEEAEIARKKAKEAEMALQTVRNKTTSARINTEEADIVRQKAEDVKILLKVEKVENEREKTVSVVESKRTTASPEKNLSIWRISKEKAGRYLKYFEQMSKGQGACPADHAIAFFAKSNIGKDGLRSIYTLCDQNPRVPLTPRTFGVLFHIVQIVRAGHPIPSKLPKELEVILRSGGISPTKRAALSSSTISPKRSPESPASASNSGSTPARRGKFVLDPASKLWYNPNTKLYFNETTQMYCKNPGGPFYVYSPDTKKLTLVQQN